MGVTSSELFLKCILVPSSVFFHQTLKSTSKTSKADSSGSMIRAMSNCMNCQHMSICRIYAEYMRGEMRSGFEIQLVELLFPVQHQSESSLRNMPIRAGCRYPARERKSSDRLDL